MAKNDKTPPPATQALQTTPPAGALAAFDYGDDAVPLGQQAMGYENQTSEDSTVPFLVLLQAMSPVVAEQKVPGAVAGQWMNTVTQMTWSNPSGLLFVPATTRHEYTQFTPRNQGGGYKGRHAIDSEVVTKAKAASKNFGEYFTPEGDELTETFYVFGAIGDADGAALGMAVIAFKSSMIRAYKNWMSLLRAHTISTPTGEKRTPPLYSHLARLTSEPKKFPDGTAFIPVINSANGSVPASMLAPTDDRFLMAKACKTLLDQGGAKVDYQKQKEGGGAGGSTDVPF